MFNVRLNLTWHVTVIPRQYGQDDHTRSGMANIRVNLYL